MKYLICTFFSLFLCVSGGHLFASDNLSADEMRGLFSGKTVEGEQREFEEAGGGFTGNLSNYAERFVSYFSEDGTIKQQLGKQQRAGEWRVTKSGKLCIEWEGKKKKCTPVYKEGDIYMRVTKNKMGRNLMEIRFIRFIPGNENNL